MKTQKIENYETFVAVGENFAFATVKCKMIK